EISDEMQRVNGIRDLMAFLSSFGVRPEDAVKVWKEYGTDSVALPSRVDNKAPCKFAGFQNNFLHLR
ncbi:MAG: hypothetical protein IIW85_02715, partial [Bacteroidaceae bacterium]|nr:hypothetical protein [Bacteroidaceae bacterium]